MVVEENRPSRGQVRGGYEPSSWWVRSRLGESLKRNKVPLGIYRSKLEVRKVEVDPTGVGSKERVDFGGNDWIVLAIWVPRCRNGVGRYWCPRHHPRIRVRLLVVVVVDNVGSLVSVVHRSPAGMGVISWNDQRGCV